MSRCRLRARITVGMLGSLFIAAAAIAEDHPIVAPPSPKFEIQQFKIEGNTLLSSDAVDKLVAPYTGKSRDFGDVQRALEALQDAYQKMGYNSVQVLLPEQELDQGIVKLRVVEQRIGSISVENNQFYDRDNILRTVPSIQPGTLPNLKKVQKSLKVANENPSKQTAILFKDSEKDETAIDATVKVIDEKPWKAFLTLDNTGSRETGHSRIGFGYQNYNLFNRDHRITLQYVTNLHFPNNYFNSDHRVNIVGGAYTIPFYEWGDSLDLLAGYSDINAAAPQQLSSVGLSIIGKGLVWGVHYNHNFDKIDDYDHKLTAGLDYRAYRSDFIISNNNLTPHVTALPWSLTYSGLWQQETQQLAFNFGGSWNLTPEWASHGGADDFGSPSAGSQCGANNNSYCAENYFSKYNFGFDYTHPFAKTWFYHVAVSGQLAGDHLIPGEQFRIGGMDSVRGWHESVISGDKGYRFSIEAISPDFGGKISSKVGLHGLVFFDKGHVNNNHGIDGTPAAIGSDKTIASVGAGLRYNYGKDIVARFDYAYVVDGDITKDNPGGSRKHGDTFGHVSLGWIW